MRLSPLLPVGLLLLLVACPAHGVGKGPSRSSPSQLPSSAKPRPSGTVGVCCPTVALSAAVVRRGETIRVTIMNCVDAAQAGGGVYFLDSEYIANPKPGKGIYQIPADLMKTDQTVRFKIPEDSTSGRASVNAVCTFFGQALLHVE